LIIPFGYYIVTQKNNKALNLILSIPALFLVPFIQMFPIGLGLKVLFGSAILLFYPWIIAAYFWSFYQKRIVVLF
jgi:hypothetical protein